MLKQSYPVTTTRITMLDRVRRIWGKEYDKSDIVYKFSNGQQYESSDRGQTGFYKKS